MDEIEILKQRIANLEQIINLLVKPDRYTFERPIAPGANGLKIGKSTTDKISAYGVAPVAQQSAITAPSGGATIDTQSRTAINSLITALKNFGITA